MKLALISSAALAAALIAAPAFAQTATAPTNYVQGNVGASVSGTADSHINVSGVGGGQADIGLDTGIFFSGLVGHSFGNGLGVEVEGLYTHNDADRDDANTFIGTNANTRTWGGLVNAKYEFHTGWHNIAPYIGGGAGYGDTRIHLEGLGSSSDSGFMWQAKAGVAVPVGQRMALDFGYRYLDTPNYNRSSDGLGQLKVDSHLHILSAGLRVNF